MLMLMLLIALQGRADKSGAPSDIPNEQPDQDASGLRSDTSRSEGQVAREDEDQEAVAEQPSAVIPKHASDGDQYEGAQCTVQPRRSGGECWRLSRIPSVKTCRLQSPREPEGVRHPGLPPFSLASQRSPKMDLVLSKLS